MHPLEGTTSLRRGTDVHWLPIKFGLKRHSPGSGGNSPSEFLFGDAPGRSCCRATTQKNNTKPQHNYRNLHLVCVCVRVCWYRGPGGWLDDPGVLGPDETETVEGGQVTVDLPLQPQPGPDLSAQTHPVLKHHRPRYTQRKERRPIRQKQGASFSGPPTTKNFECETLGFRSR